MVRRGVLVAALVVGLFGVGALPAGAHDTLLASDPEDGATVEALPEHVVLTFSAEVLDVNPRIEVSGPDGDAAVGDVVVDGAEVRRVLAAGLVEGEYRVLWSVTSSDGHPIEGEFGFVVPAGVGVEPSPEVTPETTPDATAATASPEPAASPEATASPEPTPAPAPGDVLQDSPFAWLVAGVAVVGLVLTVALLATRRRSNFGPPGQD